MSISQTIEVSSNMGKEGSLEWSIGSGTDTDRAEGANEKDTEGHPKEMDEKLEEEMKWPCGVCEENVTADGLECVVCNKWYHVGECTEIISPNEYRGKEAWQTKKGQKLFYPKHPNRGGLDSK